MIRFFFRVLATLTFAAAVVMAVLDATRSVAASKLVMTPLLDSWAATFPGALDSLKTFIETRLAGFLWDPLALAVLQLPGFAVLAGIAFLLYAVGHRTPQTRSEWV